MRFLFSFLATIFLAVLALTVFFPPERSALTDGQSTTHFKPPKGNFNAQTLSVVRPENHPNQRDYTAPENVGHSHSFAYTDATGTKTNRTWFAHRSGGFGPFPTVVLLHGSNRSGRAMIDMWQETAKREGLLLLAPNAHTPSGWHFDQDGPAFVDAMLTEAEKTYKIDRSQLYLMGHSSGAIFAQMLAVENASGWKYIATHGGSRVFNLKGHTANPTQIGIYTGDRDHLHPPSKTHPTGRSLAQIGHQVTAYDITDHNHWYYVIGSKLADHMWDEMRKTAR